MGEWPEELGDPSRTSDLVEARSMGVRTPVPILNLDGLVRPLRIVGANFWRRTAEADEGGTFARHPVTASSVTIPQEPSWPPPSHNRNRY